MTRPPNDVEQTIEIAWQHCRQVPGFLVENEARFLGTLAACIPADGMIVEIGSFKGKSTVMLATVAAHYQRGKVIAIDPHAGLSYLGPDTKTHLDPTFTEFLSNIKVAGVESDVEVRRNISREVAKDWNRPIRLLWIDGDHTYRGCKEDFDLFFPHLVNGGVVAFHDSLNAFEGPIRVFVEEILRSDRFGPCGFVHSIAWAQFRPNDGLLFAARRRKLEHSAARLLPYVANDSAPAGWRKSAYKLNRARVPRSYVSPANWLNLLQVP